MQIIANRKDGTDLTWSEVNNMIYTSKVSTALKRNKCLFSFSYQNFKSLF